MSRNVLLVITCIMTGCADHYSRPDADAEMARNAERQCILTAPSLQVAPLFGGLGGFMAAGEVRQCMNAQGYRE